MSPVKTTYDALQHCTAAMEAKNKSVAMDCPYTGKGEELSPQNLVEAALGGCILMAMGGLAMRHDIDLTGTTVDVSITNSPQPPNPFDKIDIAVNIPGEYSKADKVKLERAADACPIKHSFAPSVAVNVAFNFQE